MPKKPKYELIRCTHFAWRISRRKGVWYADGRTNTTDAGRHSLGTRDKSEAMQLLVELDIGCAVRLGLIDPPTTVPLATEVAIELPLDEGRRLYEEHIGRPRITKGVKESTKKRYRTVFDKFIAFSKQSGILSWNQVDATVLSRYAADLEKKGYLQKTLLNELVTLKQAIRWLIKAKHLKGCEPIDLPLGKVESQRAYCYRAAEVQAMVDHCRENPSLAWLCNVVVALACTGMRIGELISLKWIDIDFGNGQINLTDEASRTGTTGDQRSLKSGESRSLPIHEVLLPVLQQLARIDQYVFHGPRRGRLKADTVRRVLVREVVEPLAGKFPPSNGRLSFVDGRLHSFRHFFVSECAARGVAERFVMGWVGHADSEMVRHYFHLHDDEAKRQMSRLSPISGAVGRANGQDSDGSK